MKKKILPILLVSAIVLSMNACGSSSSSEKDPSEDPQATDQVVEDETENEKLVTKEYSGLSFNIPADAEYYESDSSVTITFEPQKKVAVIVPTDTSELDSSLSDTWNVLALSSALDAYDEVQNREDFDMTISEVSAKAATATIKLSGAWFSLSVISFVSEDNQYQYCISYLIDENADEDNSGYEAFIESITFK